MFIKTGKLALLNVSAIAMLNVLANGSEEKPTHILYAERIGDADGHGITVFEHADEKTVQKAYKIVELGIIRGESGVIDLDQFKREIEENGGSYDEAKAKWEAEGAESDYDDDKCGCPNCVARRSEENGGHDPVTGVSGIPGDPVDLVLNAILGGRNRRH